LIATLLTQVKEKLMKQIFKVILSRHASLIIILSLATVLSACSSTQASVSVGEPAPDFSLPTADGGMVTLDDYVGKQPVLLYFHMAVG
jgi:hypothetical protein